MSSTSTKHYSTVKASHSELVGNDVITHGIRGGFYDNLAHIQKIRDHVLECLCGESFSGHSWQEAGEDLDNHLREINGAIY